MSEWRIEELRVRIDVFDTTGVAAYMICRGDERFAEVDSLQGAEQIVRDHHAAARLEAAEKEITRLRAAISAARSSLPMWEASVAIERAKRILDDALTPAVTVDTALSWPGEAPLRESEQSEERRVMEEARRCYRCRMDPTEHGGTIYVRVQIDGRWQNVACCRECWDLHHANQGCAE
jgi:hypothetical protein